MLYLYCMLYCVLYCMLVLTGSVMNKGAGSQVAILTSTRNLDFLNSPLFALIGAVNQFYNDLHDIFENAIDDAIPDPSLGINIKTVTLL